MLSVAPPSLRRRALRNGWPVRTADRKNPAVAVPLELLPFGTPAAVERSDRPADGEDPAVELVAYVRRLAEAVQAARAERDRLSVDFASLMAALAAKAAAVAGLELEIRRTLRTAPKRTRRALIRRLESLPETTAEVRQAIAADPGDFAA